MLGMWRFFARYLCTCATIAFGPMPYCQYNFKQLRVTLLTDHLDPEHGIVRMRVGFALRSAEIKPLFASVFNLMKETLNDRTFIRSCPCLLFSRLRPHYPDKQCVQAVVQCNNNLHARSRCSPR